MSPRLGRQLLLVGLALSLWSAWGAPSLFALAGAYALGWIACELPRLRRLIREARPATLVLLAAALAAPGIAFGYRARADLEMSEGLLGAVTRFQDRWRTQSLPSIAPPVVSTDRPQTFFVATDGARKLSLRASGVRPILGNALGRGLFRIDYDPKRDGVPGGQASHVAVQLNVDGHETARVLDLVRPLAHPRWFCIAPDRSRAVALSEETDELFVLNGAGLERRAPTGDGPVDCAFIDAKHVAVTHRNEPNLRVYGVTAASDLRRRQHATRVRAFEAALPGTGGIETQNGTTAGFTETPLDRMSLRTLEAEFARTRATSTSTAAADIPEPLSLGARQGRLALSPSGSLLAVALLGDSPAIMLVGLPAFAVSRRIPLPYPADWIAFGADDNTLIVATRADAALHRFRAGVEDSKLELGRPVVTLSRGADGSQVWVATTDLHAAGHAQLGNHFVQDQILTISTSPFAITERHLTAERSDRQSKPGDVDRGLSPMGVHSGADGSLWLAFAGSDELWRMDAHTSTPQQIDVGDAELYAPHGIAQLADGTVLVSSPVAGAFGILAPGASTLRVVRVSPSDDQLLAQDRDRLARRAGERGFYEGTRSGISCQSCHMHADSDDAAYNLGDHRLLPTLSVRGIADTAPYLRDGSYPRIRDLDDVAQTLYRGYLRNQAARGETIEAFLRSLPRRDNPHFANERDTAAERRGLDAFFKAHCDACHEPPAFTSLAQLPLRFLFPEQAERLTTEEIVDTPSLLSVAASPPYLHDGRAATLDAVLVAENSQNRHGDVRSLTDAQRRDLIAFLRSL